MTQSTQNWWMYHGSPAHGGNAGTGSALNSTSVASPAFTTLHSLNLQGSVLSVPAVVDGYIYVGVANSLTAPAANGGAFYKIDIVKGEIVNTFNWAIKAEDRDTHGFTGMGCTPAIVDDKVYFSAFDGKLYCLNQQDLTLVWVTDLRYADLAHNQPVSNDMGTPVAAGWSSPVVANGRVYVGMGEGENPLLYGFVFCLDAQTGNVVWIYCTSLLQCDQDNPPNLLPADTVRHGAPVGFQVFEGQAVVRGCSVWSSIAYDAELNRLYCTTGNPQPDPSTIPTLPTLGYSNGLLALDAGTGKFKGFFQALPESNYRVSDTDVDVGGSPTLFQRQGKKAVGFGCKNGSYFILDADTLELLTWRQLLPYDNDGAQLPTVDPHQTNAQANNNYLNGRYTNEESNTNVAENYSGIFGTAAVDPQTQRLFVGLGGPNYHAVAPGIDYTTTPFMRAIDMNSLHDAWPMDDSNPRRYANVGASMYANPAESALSSPAVVNDVVFCSTSKVSLYAFNVKDGSLLWSDDLGMQTEGYNGGYGYCIGPAIWGNYVVAGALVMGGDGGVLRIYSLTA